MKQCGCNDDHIQITSASQVTTTYAATLHYQMAYRVQNHAFDLVLPTNTDEALLLSIDTPNHPSCISSSQTNTLKLSSPSFCLSHGSHYEKTHMVIKPVQSSDPRFFIRKDGSVEISFKKDDSAPLVFPTEINILGAVPIHSFTAEG
uniref:Uncharacterized protein n=1 Tax=Davidia involucrata TaxID=16924 RepID=A0A5B7CC79_DAVIN